MTKTAEKPADEYIQILPAAYSQGFVHVRIITAPEPQAASEDTASSRESTDDVPQVEPPVEG